MDNIVRTVDDAGKGPVAGRGMLEMDGSKLSAPDNIIMTVAAARSYYQNYRSSHTKRIGLYSAIEGLIAGNPPYPADKLAAAGIAHIANVNTLDAKGLFERAALTFWNLVHQAETMVTFTIRKFDSPDDHDYSGWSEILARNWTEVMKEEWDDFITNLNVLTGQLVKFGISPVVWSDEEDFRWHPVELSRFFVPDMMPVAMKDWTCVCFETTFTLQFLYTTYMSIKDADQRKDEDDDGDPDSIKWDKTALENFLLLRANTGRAQSPFANMHDFQLRLQNGEVNHGDIFNDSVRLVTLLYKEYSEKVSSYIFDPVGSDADGFLFQYPEQYESFSEVLSVFTYSPGEFYLHGNRGVGHKIFPVCQALMQLDCHMLDMAKTSATPVISSQPTAGRDVAPIRFIPGVVTDIGMATLQPNNMGANISQLVPVAQYMEAKVNKNAMISGDDPSRPDLDRGSKSAPEVQIQSIKEFGIGKNNVSHFYRRADSVFRTQTAKMLHCKEGHPAYEIVKEWKERCMGEGVPEEVFAVGDAPRNKLPRHLSVRATRVAGDGSNLGLIMGLNGIGGISGGFGSKGQQNYRKDVITARMGIDYVDRYLSDAQEPDEAAGGASLAAVENFMMQQGQAPVVTRDNQHKSHIGSHMAVLMHTIQEVQAQKLDPIAADKVFEIVLQHTGQHIQFITQDSLNEAYVKKLEGPWKQINKFAQLNRVRAQKMMQAELRRRSEEEQQMTADQMEQNRKDMITQRDEERKDFKVKSQVDRAKEASETRAEVMKSGVEKKAENQRLDITLKHANERADIVRKPQEILQGTSNSQLQANLTDQVGTTPNPADFE